MIKARLFTIRLSKGNEMLPWQLYEIYIFDLSELISTFFDIYFSLRILVVVSNKIVLLWTHLNLIVIYFNAWTLLILSIKNMFLSIKV